MREPPKPSRTPPIRRGLVAAGIALVVLALVALGSGEIESIRAKAASDKILSRIDEQRPEAFSAPMSSDASVVGDAVVLENEGLHPGRDEQIMPVELVDGHDYIGSVIVPTIGLNLPVAAEVDAESLRLSPCRYGGSYHTDDLVIIGEGYSSHFGSLAEVGIRDEVRFVAMDGALYRYVVSNVETARKVEEIGAIIDDWDLALFRYNVDGTCCIVRCVRTG